MGIRSQNNPAASYLDKWLATGTEASEGPARSGHTATGGLISDYTDPAGDIYRAHVFATSGTFNITALGTYPAHVEYLVVAGGGAGGYEGGGGAARGNGRGHCGGRAGAVDGVGVNGSAIDEDLEGGEGACLVILEQLTQLA